jgi:hypothetical protein
MPRRAGRATQVVGWLVVLVALLLVAQVRGILGATLQLSFGLLVACGAAGFVLAPLLRRRSGRTIPGDRQFWRRRSFQLGLVVTLLGLALAGWALVRIASTDMAAHGLRTLVS